VEICFYFAMDRHQLRSLRKARNLTQGELATLVTNDGGTVSQSMISQMELGRRPMPRKEKEIGSSATWEPSVYDELVEVLTEWSDEDIRRSLGSSSAQRGAYGRAGESPT